MWVRVSAPKIDDSSTFKRDGYRSAYFGMLDEVIDEGFAYRPESRINVAVRYCAIAQSADFSRM